MYGNKTLSEKSQINYAESQSLSPLTTPLSCSFSIIQKSNGPITKRCFVDDKGDFKKDSSQCFIANGTATRTHCLFSDFPSIISKMNTHQAIVHGVHPEDMPETVKIVSEKNLKEGLGAITRTKKYFDYSSNNNFIWMIDYDPPKGEEALSVPELIDIIDSILPGYGSTAKVITYSTSACINDEHGKRVTGKGAGYHIYALMPPGTDIGKFRDIFIVRTWLSGYGYAMISKSGSILTRNKLFDKYVLSPERLDFVSGAILPKGFTQQRPTPEYIEGTVFDVSAIPDITDGERSQFQELKKKAKLEASDKANDVKEKYIKKRGLDLYEKKSTQEKNDISLEECEKTIQAACDDRNLKGEFPLKFDFGVTKSVTDVLKKLKEYDGKTLADPMEPEAGRCKAMFYANNDKKNGRPIIHSFLHGGRNYYLQDKNVTLTLEDFNKWLGLAADNQEILENWFNQTKGMNEAIIDLCLEAVSKKTGAGKQALKKDRDHQAKKLKREKKKKAEKEKSKKLKELGITKINYDETATGEAVKQMAIAFRKSANVFRHGSALASVVEARPSSIRMVKQQHDHDNAYPSMLCIFPLTVETTRHELEKVALCVQKNMNEESEESIMFPRLLIRGLMDTPTTLDRPLTGICEHPYIDADFNPVTQQGYEPKTGLYMAFSPDLVSNFEKTPTIDQAKAEYHFLTDEVLADFPFATPLDKAGAVAMLLTGMQRKMITGDSGCPGYELDAPTQATGKTALAQTVSYALYNRPIAATSWSSSDEELGKHILGILREGHSCVLFDNLPQGTVLESDELARAMTSQTYSKRLLGENKTVTVPCQVLWLFTGNNIAIAGDFNTRVLQIRLDANMADPDKRTFKRLDIGTWCMENRKRIIHACMTIILSRNVVNCGITPSRYTEWDRFVRAPIFQISGVDVGDLFERNKAGDPKLEGQKNFLEAWYALFENTSTTAKDVLRSIRLDAHSNAANEFSEALQDIFNGNLPTTRSLGKWLGNLKGRVIGGYRLESNKGTTRAQVNKMCWKVVRVDDV